MKERAVRPDDVTLELLQHDFHAVLRGLRAAGPVVWVPALKGWVVTRRDLVVEMMRDADRFTVDDPRFSTGQVLGPSMLSLDGAEHARHRAPFADAFRLPAMRSRFDRFVASEADRTVGLLARHRSAELRRDLAGPLAVAVVVEALGLADTDSVEVLAWYEEIVDAVSRASSGQVIVGARPPAVELLAAHVRRSLSVDGSLVASAAGSLSVDEVVSNVAVVMFGGIETSEGATANAFAHLLTRPELWEQVRAEPALAANAVEESLRLEPAVVQVDRFATCDVDVGGVTVRRGDFVMLSIAAANRDPEVFDDPDRFLLDRPNSRAHLTFAQGPHACIGIHLARAEARSAITAAAEWMPGLRLTAPAEVRGIVFRKPVRVDVAW